MTKIDFTRPLATDHRHDDLPSVAQMVNRLLIVVFVWLVLPSMVEGTAYACHLMPEVDRNACVMGEWMYEHWFKP